MGRRVCYGNFFLVNLLYNIFVSKVVLNHKKIEERRIRIKILFNFAS